MFSIGEYLKWLISSIMMNFDYGHIEFVFYKFIKQHPTVGMDGDIRLADGTRH